MSRSQNSVPRALLGTLNFSRRTTEIESIAILTAAHDVGIRGINTADTDYSGRSEYYVGRFLRTLRSAERPFLMVELSGVDMGVPHDPDLSPDYLRRACIRSLNRLGVESVDRIVIPRPSFRTPLEETLAGVQQHIIGPGLAASYGVSTFPAWLTCHGQHECRDKGYLPPVSELAPYNVLDRRVENEVLPNARFWGMQFFAWAALGQGLLAGRYPRFGNVPADSRAAVLGGIYEMRVGGIAREVAARFVNVCREFGYQPATAALAWVLSQDGVTGFVAGPRTVDQIEPLAAAENLQLDTAFVKLVDGINPPGTAAANFFNSAPWMLQQI